MFPLGIEHYLIGGILVGIGVSLIYILTGLHATQSSFFTTTLSWLSKRKHFQKEQNKQERNWRVFLAIGLVLGALIYTLTLSPTGFWSTSVQLWRLALGVIRLGTRSLEDAHPNGISGLASLSVTSLSAVIVFMGIAIVTANVVQLIGVLP